VLVKLGGAEVPGATVVEGNHGGAKPLLEKRPSKKTFRVMLLMFLI
jgi:hypothetical protein